MYVVIEAEENKDSFKNTDSKDNANISSFY